MDIKNTTTEDLLTAIRAQQDIQKRSRPTTPAWQVASKALQPLFAEMSRRFPPGTVGPAI